MKRGCQYPNCANLAVPNGIYCPAHQYKVDRDYNRYTRAGTVNQIYGSEWKRIRKQYAEAHPLCEECLKAGRAVTMDEVHHILPVSRGGTNSPDNLKALCRSCHEKAHIDLGDRGGRGV